MQKLVFVNGAGKEINLTSGNFGIVNWEGLSNTDLNIQSQQVPFEDGGVFLDALMEQREIAVTVAIYDGNDLELRYQKKRELISALNPKLGEGTLIYTNDYLSRQIKAVPQIPLFENKNSNDAGTLKASVAFTCCSPYWEDVKATEIYVKSGERKIIKNEGDITTQVIIDFYTNNVTNPQIKNFTENKSIKLDGVYNTGIVINTNIGKKQITEENMAFNLHQFAVDINSIIYVESKGLFFAVGNDGLIITSPDGENWTSIFINETETFTSITYSESKGLFIIVGDNLYTSQDGLEWVKNGGTFGSLLDVKYIDFLDLFITCGMYGEMQTSSDGLNWNSQTSGTNAHLYSIANSSELVVIVDTLGIITSSDGVNWTRQTIPTQRELYSVTYGKGLFVTVGNDGLILTSPDGVNWTQRHFSDDIFHSVIYSETLGLYVVVGAGYVCLTSKDGVSWTKSHPFNDIMYSTVYSRTLGIFISVGRYGEIFKSTNADEWENINHSDINSSLSMTYSEKLHLYVCVGGSIKISHNGLDWNTITTMYSLNSVIYSEEVDLFVAVGNDGLIITSPDGETWTQRTSGTNKNIKCVIYSNDKNMFIAVGDNGVTCKSTNGINWSVYNVGYDVTLSVLVQYKYLFLTTDNSGIVYTSPDGETWTQEHTSVFPSTDPLNAMFYSSIFNVIIAVGNNGKIFVCNNITDWTLVDSGTINNLNNIVYSEETGLFVIVGDIGTILTSSDGLNWKKFQNISISLKSEIYVKNENIFMIGGLNGVMIKSFFVLGENIISKLSQDSNMTFGLEVGNNEIVLSKDSGNLNAKITYRQKYIGV